jgi:hypothetical protein
MYARYGFQCIQPRQRLKRPLAASDETPLHHIAWGIGIPRSTGKNHARPAARWAPGSSRPTNYLFAGWTAEAREQPQLWFDRNSQAERPAIQTPTWQWCCPESPILPSLASVSSRVRVKPRSFLEQFQREWKYHHPLSKRATRLSRGDRYCKGRCLLPRRRRSLHVVRDSRYMA